jgi:hypothetical protein
MMIDAATGEWVADQDFMTSGQGTTMQSIAAKAMPVRKLDAAKLTSTAAELAKWIAESFDKASLSRVALGVGAYAHEAVARADSIRRPIWYIRLTVLALLIGTAIMACREAIDRPMQDILKFLDETKGAAAWAGGAVLALVTLEFRVRRRRALKAINELRALVHIVDMHQLAKDPVIEDFRANEKQTKVEEYLHACSALLAILSKIGEFYIEQFPDPTAISAVNEFEMIATGLSNKIWMKILSTQNSFLVRNAQSAQRVGTKLVPDVPDGKPST